VTQGDVGPTDVYRFVEVDIDGYLNRPTLEKFLNTLAVFGYLNTFKTLVFAQYLNTLNKYLL